MKIQSILQSQCLSLTLLVAINSPTHAAPGDISNTPLFTSNNSQPNVFFEVDDSGSMDWEFLTIEHWHACGYNINSDSCGIWMIEGLPLLWSGTQWLFFYYIYDNTDDSYINGCDSDTPTIDLCPGVAGTATYDWRNFSSSFNVLYYNPDTTYEPWEEGDGSSMGNASFTAARSDPQSGKTGYTDTKNLTGIIYHVWSDTHGFSGAHPTSFTSNKTTGANNMVDWWDEHLRYTVNASSITVDTITYTGTKGNTETLSSTTTLTGTGTHTLLGGKTIAEVQQNIANWYQYYRKRSFVAKAAIANVVSENTDFRYGLNFINDSNFTYNSTTTDFIEVPSGIGSTSANSLLLDGLFNLVWPNFGTPLRQGLERAGKYFDNTDSHTDPITNSCQQNYTVLFTDGYWNGSDPASGIGNADGDGHSITVADVAKYYYDQDLSLLDNDVVPNVFDTATHQHMVTYSVAFGVEGSLTDTDNDGWPGTSPGINESDDWGDPINSTPAKIDDLWHAAYNSKGTFVSASTPQEVSQSLSDALGNINDRSGSAASVAFNTTTLTGNSAVYLAQFNSNNSKWSGDLLSFALNSTTGDVASNYTWSAATLLDSDADPVNNRKIFTYNGTQGVPFQWGNLTTSQQADLKTNPDGSTSADSKAQARLNFLRGDRSNDADNSSRTYTFRKRTKLLGDIIHSDPIYVGVPQLYWPDASPFPDTIGTNTYDDFKSGSAHTRTPIIYVGSNDGMLHGFNSSTGAEVMAYIPNHSYSSASATEGLHYLTDVNYSHRYYVDMPVAVSDVYIDKSDSVDENSDGSNDDWHTILIGGGRAGSRGIFALDITDPTNFVEDSTHADKLVLWEFDSSDDTDLGYTFSKPIIGMLNNGKWAAIFGNGYNSTGDGKAKLFILFLEGGLDGTWTAGTDYLEISTGVGSIVSSDCTNASSDCNGLSTPQAVDMDGDKIIDRVYAGDLKGNLWAFDLTGSNTGNWNIAHKQGPNYKPLFTATHHDTLSGSTPTQISTTAQPITDKPILVKHPSGLGGDPDVLVFFGTGQYLNSSDITDTSVQSFYGVWDKGDHSLTPANLIEQSFISDTFMNDGNDVSSSVRIITDESVDYAGSDMGWLINLTLASGERVIVDPDVRGDYVFFNTWIPDANPCNAGGEGYLMVVKQLDGGRPDSAVFDLDGDGSVDSSDLVTVTMSDGSGGTITVSYSVSGEKFSFGLPASSNFLSTKQYTPGTDGGSTIHTRTIESIDSAGTGRLAWQELR